MAPMRSIRSDLEWFGPSLPHTSILTVLEFIGMSKTWLGFFKAFLQAPIRFPGEANARVRKRGTPISYSLSVCGEVVLLMMDFVNQRTNGLYPYRMHDDLWLWDADPQKVAGGWREMKKFARLVGLRRRRGPLTLVLRTKRLLVCLRAIFVGVSLNLKSRFVIDQKDVDFHIKEMKRQRKVRFRLGERLQQIHDLFHQELWWRSYHICDMIDTFARIQHGLFADGGAIGYLRKTIKERFDTTDLPEGYFYFPLSSGGLDLQNCMSELLALDRRDKPLTLLEDEDDAKSIASANTDYTIDEDSDDESEPDDEGSEDLELFNEDKAVADQKFKKRINYDRKLYASMKEVWDLDTDNRRSKKGNLYKNMDFMSFDEYATLRETWLSGWGQSYNHMLQTPNLRQVSFMPGMRQLTTNWHGWNDGRGNALGWYGKWVVNMYGKEVVRKFGGLEVVDPNLIPIGMVELFKSSRMKLDQWVGERQLSNIKL